MQGIAEAIKYLYQQFILRDVVAYVAPGAILAACLLRLHLGGLGAALNFVKEIPPVAYVPIYGLLFTMGLGIQNFGEIIKLLKEHTRKSDKIRFNKLQDFHRAVLSREVATQMMDEYREALERTRERIEIKKYASGNIALALLMAAIAMSLTKISTNSASWSILVIGAILVVSLIRANRCQAKNVEIWEDGVLPNHRREN